ncbi:MAG: DUF87 domain-containing protein [Actinomycetota bacterium]|nr:DUF87 domain-containing protein [Actinomycetota bacterium]
MMPDIKEALERLRPALGGRADTLWALYLSSDREGREELEQHIRLLDLKLNRTGPSAGPPPLPPPDSVLLDGWLRLGEVVYPSRTPTPFGIEPGELIQHMAIFGRSGAGKTNTVLSLLRGLMEKRLPFLIFDWKRNYRDLLAAGWVAEGEVAALTVGRDLAPLRLNPLRPPPGTEPRTWLKKLIEIIAHAYFLGEGVMYLLQEAIDTCYRQTGVYDGGTVYPTFHDVHTYLRAKRVNGREANWMASTLRAVGSLTYGPMGETVCARESTDLGSLLKRKVILELDALTDADKVFVVEAMLLFIHHLRLADGEREKLKHVILVEEAHHVFLKAKQEASGGEPITDVILREIRELGEAVVLVDQHPSQIAITALGNTYCTIAMNLKHRADVNTVADACLLEPEQKEHLGRLPVGYAVVKLQDRWTSPFIVRFPHVRMDKGSVSDARLAALLGGAEPGAGNTRSQGAQVVSGGVPDVPEVPKPAPVHVENVDAADLLRLLRDVALHPACGVTDRYHRLELSRRRGTALKKRLVSEGIAREVDVALPGGRVTLLEPTVGGWEHLGQGLPSRREGGVVHRFWVERIAVAFRARGFVVETEVAAGEGRSLDIVARKGGDEVAVEVEVSGRRLADSVEKLGVHAAGRKVLACASTEVLTRARTLVASRGSPAIQALHTWALVAGAKTNAPDAGDAKETSAS